MPHILLAWLMDASVAVQSLRRVWLFVISWTTAMQASLSTTISWSLLKLMCIESVMPSNHLILCCPLLLLPEPLGRVGYFFFTDIISNNDVWILYDVRKQGFSVRKQWSLQNGIIIILCSYSVSLGETMVLASFAASFICVCPLNPNLACQRDELQDRLTFSDSICASDYAFSHK